MEAYKILGVDEHASMDVVKRAYENKVKKFNEEILDPRKLKKFIELFDKAYETIKEEREKIENDETVFMKVSDIESRGYLKNNGKSYNEEDYYEDEEEYYEDEEDYYEDEWQEEEFEDYQEDITKKKKSGKDKLSILEIIEKPLNIIEKYIKEK